MSQEGRTDEISLKLEFMEPINNLAMCENRTLSAMKWTRIIIHMYCQAN